MQATALRQSPPHPQFQCCMVTHNRKWLSKKTTILVGRREILECNIEIGGAGGKKTTRDKIKKMVVFFGNTGIKFLFFYCIPARE